MKSILDRSFQYTPSSQTDLKKTFARIRRERRKEEEAQELESAVKEQTVTQLPTLRRRNGGGA